MDDRQGLQALRHSTAHLLAAAVMELYPKTKRAIGPAIEHGFYYDFDFSAKGGSASGRGISDADLPKIEAKMRQLLPKWTSFTKKMLTASEAKKASGNNPFKAELIDEFSQNGKKKISFFESGGFADLCKGGHTDNPAKDIKAFKLLSVAGAYWRGDETKPMLTRIYGTVFSSQKELDDYLKKLELAKVNDHRILGQKLQLYIISEAVGPGLPLWLPKGQIIKDSLETWVKKIEEEWGYQRVTTPNIGKSELYRTSGHLPYYAKDMYPPMKLGDGEEYRLKPMNCPHHHQIYAASPKSYKDLPVRLAEYGTCYRYEASGELFGLMRVRGFTQNDAHIYCTESQAVDEFVSVMKLHQFFYKTLGIANYHLELALRDPKKKDKYHGHEEMWAKAEDLMRQAVKQVDIPMVEDRGSAAFYGPKIDFVIESSIGREFAISTNQIDLFMGGRFHLKYTDSDGKEKTPVIIHRAPLGSHERFIGFLIEHYGGAFPVWLHPVQVAVVPIGPGHVAYAQKIAIELKKQSIRVEVAASDHTMQAKVRETEEQKIPYLIIVGDKEVKAQNLSIRGRGRKDLGIMTLPEFTDKVTQAIYAKEL